jgi:hypothetical protein
MTTILVAKNKNLVVMGTCNYKPIIALDKWQKKLVTKNSTWHVHTSSCISLTTIGIFHPLTNHKTMQLQILHKILGSI